MIDLKWKIEGEKQLARRMNIISKGVKTYTPVFKDAANKLKAVFEDFGNEGREIGESWEKLKPSTIEQKSKKGYSSSPLIKTGDMQKSFTTLYKTDYAAVWNTTSYFKYHQSSSPRSKLPRRVMMKLGSKQKEMVVKLFHEYVHKLIRKK